MTSQGKTEALDPITVEVVRYKLDGIANEMQSTLLRSSFSPIVKEGLDASASLFTADGTTLSQSCSIPIHLATLIPAVAKARTKNFRLDRRFGNACFILLSQLEEVISAKLTLRAVNVYPKR